MTASNDEGYASGAPSIVFSNFALDDFDYLAVSGISGSTVDFGSFYNGFDDLEYLYGEWRTTVEITPVSSVPVLAAIWLFGSGLLGLIEVA